MDLANPGFGAKSRKPVEIHGLDLFLVIRGMLGPKNKFATRFSRAPGLDSTGFGQLMGCLKKLRKQIFDFASYFFGAATTS